MTLVNSGRLSVQSVSEETWAVVEMMAEKGGWNEINFAKSKAKKTKGDGGSKNPTRGRVTGKGKKDRKDAEEEDVSDVGSGGSTNNTSAAGRKRKVVDEGDAANDLRRSTRARK